MAEEKKGLELLEENIQKADAKLGDIEKALKGKVDADTLKTVSDTVDSLKESLASIEQVEGKSIAEYVKATQEHANTLELKLKEMKDAKGVVDPTLDDKVKSLVTGDEWKAHMKSMRSNKGGSQFIIEKAANDLLTSDWTADSGAVGLPQLQLPGVTKHPWKDTPIFAAVQKRSVGMDHEVSYTEELTRSDAAALKAEGSQYAQSGATWITKVLSFYDLGHFVKVSRESLEDAEYIRQEMNDLLNNGLLRHIESLLFSGSGSSTIGGAYTLAKTFAKQPGVISVADASMRDILLAAKLQVARGYTDTDTAKKGYRANMSLIGQSSGYNVTTEKDDIGRPFVDDLANWRPGGMAIVESQDVTESATSQTFLTGDFTKAMLFLKRNLTIETGYDGNDFTYGMMTMRASIRGNLLIKNLETYAFVKGDFYTAPGLLSA